MLTETTTQLTEALSSALSDADPGLLCHAIETQVNPATSEWQIHVIQVQHAEGGGAIARIHTYRGDASVNWNEAPPVEICDLVKCIAQTHTRAQWEVA